MPDEKFEKFDKMMADLVEQEAKATQDSVKKDKPKVTDKLPKANTNNELDRFRYLLTLLFVSVKLGLFAYLDPNPLADISWFIVFLPAYIVEALLGAAALVIALVAVIGLVGMYGFIGIKDIVRRFKRDKEPSVFPTVDHKDGW